MVTTTTTTPTATPTTATTAVPPTTTTTTDMTTAVPTTDHQSVTNGHVEHHPFAGINRPFKEAVTHSEQQENWSFHKGDIGIEMFTKAITAFLNIFDAIGSKVITDIVRKDFRWKINGLKNAAKRLKAESVRELARKELESPPRFWAPSGITSLLWALRILGFVEQLVDNLVQDAALELRDAGTRAYRGTLAPRHPPMTKVIFEKALNLVPPRATFVSNLTEHNPIDDNDVAIVLVGMKDFLRSTRPFIESLTTLIDMEDIDEESYR